MSRRRRILASGSAVALLATVLAPSLAGAEPRGPVSIETSNVSNDYMDVSINLANEPDDGTWDEGDTAAFHIYLTNKTGAPRGIALADTNLQDFDYCKYEKAQPGASLPCNQTGKLTHTITAEDVQAGVFQPYATFLMFDETGYTSDAIMETSVGQVPYADSVSTELTLTNAKAEGVPWSPGEKMDFTLKLTNKTDIARSFQAAQSNMEGWEGCKWTKVEPGQTLECPFPSHTVTEADLARGFFTPYVMWIMYGAPGYPEKDFVKVPSSFGPTVTVSNSLEIISFAPAEGQDPAALAIGDAVTFDLTVRNTGEKAVTLTNNNDALMLDEACSQSITPGQELACTASYTLTKQDVCAGEVSVTLDLAAVASETPVGFAAQKAAVTTAGQCEKAVSASAPDADPALEVRKPQLSAIRTAGTGHNIRIPAIAVATNGDLLAAYDYRPTNGRQGGGDSPNENWIMQRRSTDNGATWGPETIIARGIVDRDNPHGYSDPSYIVDRETGTIFNFHVYSQYSGIFANNPQYPTTPDGSIDEKNKHVVNLGLSVSHDNGYTWEQRVVTNSVLVPWLKDYDIKSCFATSGAGTQKMAEPHKGRLLQQIACVVDANGNNQSDTNDDVLALTMYSDDHGETWKGGQPTANTLDGQRLVFDENKIVELSDGKVMLNSRASRGAGQGARIVAISEDGGETWGDYRVDKTLVDPANNAQIIRAFPNAKPGTLRSKVILFSNSNLPDARNQGTLWISYDDGATWDTKKVFREGGTGYSTMAIQSDGSIGILFEPRVWNDIGYTNTTLSWLDPELKTELAAKEIEAQTGTDRAAITPIALSNLFDHNDPLLADTVEITGVKGLAFHAETGMIEGTPWMLNDAEQSYDVSVTLTEEEDGTGRPRTATATFTLTLEPGEAVSVTPARPTNTNPSAIDPAHCATKPYVTTDAPDGVSYTADIDGTTVTPDENSRYTYDYGRTLHIAAHPHDGFVFPENAVTEWTFTADVAPQCAGGTSPGTVTPDEGTSGNSDAVTDNGTGSSTATGSLDKSTASANRQASGSQSPSHKLAWTGVAAWSTVGLAVLLTVAGVLSIRLTRRQ